MKKKTKELPSFWEWTYTKWYFWLTVVLYTLWSGYEELLLINSPGTLGEFVGTFFVVVIIVSLLFGLFYQIYRSGYRAGHKAK